MGSARLWKDLENHDHSKSTRTDRQLFTLLRYVKMASNPYFQMFTTNGFKAEANAEFEDEFDRLADHMGWLSLGNAYNRHHANAQALEQQGGTRLPHSTQNHVQSQSYFSRFAADGFVPNPNASFKNEFSRLAKDMGWSDNTLEYGHHRLLAYQAEFNVNYGSSDKLQGWQDLCRDVGITPIPTSIKQCKKVSVCPDVAPMESELTDLLCRSWLRCISTSMTSWTGDVVLNLVLHLISIRVL